MIVLEPALVCQFLNEHQMLERKIMRVVYHEELCPILVKVSYEFGLAGGTMSGASASLMPCTGVPRAPSGAVVAVHPIPAGNHRRWPDRNSAPALPASC